MTLTRLARIVANNLRRNCRHLMLAALGIVFGIATLTFFLALGAGVRSIVLGQVFPIDQIEVVPSTMDLDLFAFRVGMGSALLDDAAVARIAAIPGVARVFPKMKLTVPGVASGGQSLIGNRIATELIADGIDPELLGGSVGDEFANPPEADPDPISCLSDQDCPDESMYCATPYEPPARVCRSFIPVIVSNYMVELYNGSLCHAYGLPRMNPDFMVGFKCELAVGASMVRASAQKQVYHERLQLVGFSDRAVAIGVTMPIGYVRRFNAAYGGPEAAKQYHSAVVELVSRDRMASVTAGIDELGFDVADSGVEQAAVVIAVLMLVFALVSVVIVAVAAINIMHLFLMLISQRRQEIGVMRALGARRADVRKIFLAEAGAVGLLAGSCGVLVALVGARCFDFVSRHYVPDFPFKPETFFHFSPGLLAMALLFSVVLCVLGALVPAHRAARTDPAASLTGPARNL